MLLLQRIAERNEPVNLSRIESILLRDHIIVGKEGHASLKGLRLI